MRYILMLSIALAAGTTHAASMRCNGDLIRSGDSIVAVHDSCGQPVREARIVNDYGNQVGTALYYKGQYGQNDRKVILKGGKVDRVERLD